MNTRWAKDKSEFNQERYCSSPDLEAGLLANVVSKRCRTVKDSRLMSLLFFVQYFSHQPGGLKHFARQMVDQYPEALMTMAMRSIGIRPGQTYGADAVRKVRADIPEGEFLFPLRGESDWEDLLASEPSEELLMHSPWLAEEWKERQAAIESRQNRQPNSYPGSVFLDACRSAAENELESLLQRWCIDPAFDAETLAPWYWPSLLVCLLKRQEAHAAERIETLTETAVSKEIFDSLDYCLENKCLVLIEGMPRTGKTFATKAWCEANVGRVRYVQVPATSDDIGFFRKIAEAIGTSSALSLKGIQLRERVEKALQSSKLGIVFDEAHYLFPQNNRREALPNRINWIMTALVNYGVPVAMVTTPQFTKDRQVIELKTGWTSEQFTGRIALSIVLPATLPRADLIAVAKTYLPGGSERALAMLADYARASTSCLAGIDRAVMRARHVAAKAGRTKVSEIDLKEALGFALKMDAQLSESHVTRARRPGCSKPARETEIAKPLQGRFGESENALKDRNQQLISSTDAD